MTDAAIEPVHQRFSKLYADSQPVRGPSELAAAVEAAGLSPDRVTDAWLRSLSDDWVYGRSDSPFEDGELENRVYRQILQGSR